MQSTTMNGPLDQRRQMLQWHAPTSLLSGATVKLTLPHTQRPYLDNIVKAVSDGLNRIAYADDNQIATLHAQKRWGEADGTFVTVEELQKKPGENNGH